MKGLRSLDGGPLHPAVPGLVQQLDQGQIDRRTFLRTLSWLGVAAAGGAASSLTACAPAQDGDSRDSLRFACAIQQITDPALSTWVEASNLYRNALEFLTEVDADNITHPHLAESWRASEDLKTWQFNLRKDVTWSNGDPFTAEDVLFNFRRWLSPDSKSVNRTSFSAVNAVERVDDHTVIVHLSRPLCALPEQLYAWTCPMLHRRFDAEGADWPKNPIGTGPYRLERFNVGRDARFVRRDDYWGAKPFLARIDYVDLGTDISTHVAALSAGQVDILYRVTIAELDLVQRVPGAVLVEHEAAQTLVLRMQVDKPPFNDRRIRQAVQLAADNAAMLALAYRGRGQVGENHHVAPSQPDYAPLPRQARNLPLARQLLGEAGHPDGIDLELTLGNTQGRYEQDTAQVLQQNLAEAGIRLKLNVIPAPEYWSVWDKVPFGLTSWAHRPLGVMTLDLAYRTGSVWNESRFSNPAFDAGLDRALGILDPKERAAEMAQLEQILQDQAVMVQPYWCRKFTAISPRVRNYPVHPSDYFRMTGVTLA